MQNLFESKPVIAVIGGDNRVHDFHLGQAIIRTFASPRYAGNGSVHRAIAAIGHNTLDLVVLMVRWLGHSEFRSISVACRLAGVPVLVVLGGFSNARKRVCHFIVSGGDYVA